MLGIFLLSESEDYGLLQLIYKQWVSPTFSKGPHASIWEEDERLLHNFVIFMDWVLTFILKKAVLTLVIKFIANELSMHDNEFISMIESLCVKFYLYLAFPLNTYCAFCMPSKSPPMIHVPSVFPLDFSLSFMSQCQQWLSPENLQWVLCQLTFIVEIWCFNKHDSD